MIRKYLKGQHFAYCYGKRGRWTELCARVYNWWLGRAVELLPCPYCGGAAKPYCGKVTCSNEKCKMHFGLAPNMHTPEEWNTRNGVLHD